MALSSVHGEDRARVRRGTMKRPASSAPATHDDEATPARQTGVASSLLMPGITRDTPGCSGPCGL
ncbi:guanine nucleotide exchange factor domain-containing protein [Nitratidesulfovibrio vulgaris RCH1]|nr:guanine nucleotide exchange factor domain-containing protein [Nitratidesulfovibrio vulgaris RCH1]